MALVHLPAQHVITPRFSALSVVPGQRIEEGMDGRPYVTDAGGKRLECGMTLAARDDAASAAAFWEWHEALRGADNEIDLPVFQGVFATGISAAPVGVALRWTAIADAGVAGSVVTLAYTPADADLSEVVAVGNPIRLLGVTTAITAVTATPSNGTAVVQTAYRFPPSTDLTETRLAYDYTAIAGSTGMGASEAAGGRLLTTVSDVANGIQPALVEVDLETGAPDTASPVGSLNNPTGGTWFPTEHGARAIATLPNGRYAIFRGFDDANYVVMNADGLLRELSEWTTPQGATARGELCYLAASSTTRIAGFIRGATTFVDTVYIINNTGAVSSVNTRALLQPSDGAGAAAFTIGASQFDYVRVNSLGSIVGVTAVAGMWTAPDGVRALMQVGGSWGVFSIDVAGRPPTATRLYTVTTRPYVGAAQIGSLLFASASNRIWRISRASDTSVEVGLQASVRRFRLVSPNAYELVRPGFPTVTYRLVEIV